MRGTKRLAVLLVVLTVGCGHSPPAYTSHYAPDSPSAHAVPVAIIGDSYTGGSPFGGEGDKGWPTLVTAQLRKQGVRIYPDMSPQGGSGYALRGPEGGVFADQVKTVVRPDDRLVVLFGSRNDVDVSPAELAPAVQRTLVEVKEKVPSAKLLVIGFPWVGDPYSGALQARDVLKTAAEALGATFVDPLAEGWFVGRPELIGSDGVHPSDAGHVYMADKIAPLIAQQLA